MKPIQVICYWWQGDRWQRRGFKPDITHVNHQQQHMRRAGQVPDTLPERYINNLYFGVRDFAGQSFNFICFTNERLDLHPDIEVRHFQPISQHGVLPRLHMFSREAGLFGHQVLCLDIDVVIVGALDDILAYDGRFCTRSKFKPGEHHKLDGDIMSFRADRKTEQIFWQPFVNDVVGAERFTQGRERYWIRHVAGDFADRWDHVAPNQVVSYKWHVRPHKRLPKQARVVSCHGIPRPHEITDTWIKEFWK